MSKAPLLARALNLPGAILDGIGRDARPLATLGHDVSLAAPVLAMIGASPRANGYLSLEPGLCPLTTDAGLLAVAVTRRHAFAVGGIHLTPAARATAPETEAATVALLTSFRREAVAAGYRRALLFPVDADELPAVRQAGFDALAVGAEAHVDLTRFAMAGRRLADLRQMLNRATKRYRLRVFELPAAEAQDASQAVIAGWQANRPIRSPMRLLIGSPCFERAANRRYFACFAPASDHAVALITVTPGWDGAGAGLDVMARAPETPAGAMELLVHHAMMTLAAEGATRFSLGACPMALLGTARPPTLAQRLLHRVFRGIYRSRLMNRLFHFRSLVQFKSKFVPDWRPVYLAGWPRIGAGALYAGCRMWGLFGSDPCLPSTTVENER